jgi:hypothetical protein
MRDVDDPLNAIAAGAATGVTLAIRQGPRAMISNGIIGGILLALIEGGLHGFNVLMDKSQKAMREAEMEQQMAQQE